MMGATPVVSGTVWVLVLPRLWVLAGMRTIEGSETLAITRLESALLRLGYTVGSLLGDSGTFHTITGGAAGSQAATAATVAWGRFNNFASSCSWSCASFGVMVGPKYIMGFSGCTALLSHLRRDALVVASWSSDLFQLENSCAGTMGRSTGAGRSIAVLGFRKATVTCC